MRTKIAFLISTKGHGRGGHFYSLKATATELAKTFDVSIINIGSTLSPVFEGMNCPVVFIGYENVFESLKKIIKHIDQEKPDILHAFDQDSLFFIRAASLLKRIPFVSTKCGGRNPNRYFPKVSSLVLYSLENMSFFETSKRFKPDHLYFLPNRVCATNINESRAGLLRKHAGNNDIIFLRISRIAENYKKSFLQSIALTERLNNEIGNVKLIIVGAIQDVDIFNELMKLSSDTVKIFTSDEYTLNASELIDDADFVIGTGRGFIEGSLKEKCMLVPVENGLFPLLVTKNNILDVAAHNFSLRCKSKSSEEDMIHSIKEVILDESKRSALVKEINHYIARNYAVEGIGAKYQEVYSNSKIQTKNFSQLFNLLIHGYLTNKNMKAANI